MLHIGNAGDRRIELPHDAITQTIAILAMRGAGKTYTAAVLFEEFVDAGLPAIVFDPLGVWWGIRSSADGKSHGLPVLVLGGDHADLSFTEHDGALIADLLVEQRRPAVVDLSHMRKGEQTRFMAACAARIFETNRAPLHLIFDEADAFAPQSSLPGEKVMLGAMEDLQRRGRSRGIGMTLITQRAACLNKSLLTQSGTIIALRSTGPQDRAAIDAWISSNGSAEQREELMGSLASLATGEAWIWSPGWLEGLFARVKIRTRRTFDSSKTPTMGARVEEPAAFAPLDLEALRARLLQLVDAARPPGQRRRAARGAGQGVQLSRLPARITELEAEVEEVRIAARSWEAAAHDATNARDLALAEAEQLRKRLVGWDEARRLLAPLARALGSVAAEYPAAAKPAPEAAPAAAVAAPATTPPEARQPRRARPAPTPEPPNGETRLGL